MSAAPSIGRCVYSTIAKRSSRGRHWKRPRNQRRTAVTQISPTTSLLRADESDNEVFLIGTAHISDASANEVSELVSVVRPQKVFIELDPARAARLRSSANDDAGQEDQFEKAVREALKNFSRGGMPGGGEGMLGAAFSGFYGLLKRYGYVPGVEMLAAMDEADRVGAELYYGDRDVNDTLRELRAAFQPSMLMSAMATPPPPELQHILEGALGGAGGGGMDSLASSVEALKTREHARFMTTWMVQAMPSIAEVMIHRRDRAMARNLRLHCAQSKVVAVVGLAHVDGIEREWQDLAPSLLPP